MNYDLSAELYDVLLGPLLRGIRKSVVNLAKDIVQKGSFLEIASGTGEQAEYLAMAGYKVKAYDLSEGMLNVAKRRNNKNLEFVLGNAESLPCKDKSYDFGLTSFFLHETSHRTREKAIGELNRVSKNYIILVDYTQPKTLLDKAFRYFIVFIEFLAGKEHYNNYKSFMKEGALEGFIKKHGLKIDKAVYHYFNNIGVFRLVKL